MRAFFHSEAPRLLIVNDKGYAHAHHLDYDEQFNLIVDGSYASSVNFDAIISTFRDSLYHDMPSTDNPGLQTHIFSNQPSLLFVHHAAPTLQPY